MVVRAVALVGLVENVALELQSEGKVVGTFKPRLVVPRRAFGLAAERVKGRIEGEAASQAKVEIALGKGERKRGAYAPVVTLIELLRACGGIDDIAILMIEHTAKPGIEGQQGGEKGHGAHPKQSYGAIAIYIAIANVLLPGRVVVTNYRGYAVELVIRFHKEVDGNACSGVEAAEEGVYLVRE